MSKSLNDMSDDMMTMTDYDSTTMKGKFTASSFVKKESELTGRYDNDIRFDVLLMMFVVFYLIFSFSSRKTVKS